jgi:hypothetical protein
MRRRLACLSFFLFLLAASREPPWADGQVTYDTARALVDRRELQIHTEVPPYFYTVREGRRYGFGGIGNVIAHVPSYLAYKSLRRLSRLPEAPLYALASHLSSAALMAIACGLFAGLCRDRGATPAFAALLALVLAVGTIAFLYARSPYSEALQTLALLLFIERVLAQGRAVTGAGMAGLGAAAGVLVASKVVYAVVLPLAAVYLLSGPRARLARGALLALAAFTPFCALVLLHNQVKTGSLFATGYPPGSALFAGELVPALYGYVFSTGQGMFLYSPPLLLGLLGLPAAWRERRRETALLLGVIAALMVVNAKYSIWHGGYNWGPRLIVPLTPLLLLLAVPWLPRALDRGRVRARRLAFAALVACGVAVQALGAAFYWDHYIRMVASVRDQTGGQGWSADYLPDLYYVPQFSPLRGHAWLLKHYLAGDPDLGRDAPWRRLVTKPIDLSWHWARLRLDWWGFDWLGGDGSARAAGAMILAILLAGALASAAAVRRHLVERGEGEDRAAGQPAG